MPGRGCARTVSRWDPLAAGTIREAISWAVRSLSGANCESPRLDAELLLAQVLGLSRADLHIHFDEALGETALQRFGELVRRRAAREPLAYILGRRAFYDTELVVDSRVLIPRPETEQIVDVALAWAHSLDRHGDLGRSLMIADVGTGSGALAVVLARRVDNSYVVGVDVSIDAIQVAGANVLAHGLRGRVGLVCANLLDALEATFDVIVANLPYIPSARLRRLQPEVADYEPRLALDGGTDGLAVIREFMPQAASHLARPGLLLIEIDHLQGDPVREMGHRHLPDGRSMVLRDLAGLERIVRVER